MIEATVFFRCIGTFCTDIEPFLEDLANRPLYRELSRDPGCTRCVLLPFIERRSSLHLADRSVWRALGGGELRRAQIRAQKSDFLTAPIEHHLSVSVKASHIPT